MEIDTTTDPPPQRTAHDARSSTRLTAESTRNMQETEGRVLIEWLRGSGDVTQRVTAAHQLPQIAKALGPERTQQELLPFITDGAVDDGDDEVLLAVASSLGKMLDSLPSPVALLRPLEVLAMVEESVVRETAIQSIQTVVNELDKSEAKRQDMIHQHFLPMLERLAQQEWFTARCAAVQLLPFAFPYVPDDRQKHFLQLFQSLCQDDTPMVRRVAAQHLGHMVEQVVHVLGRDKAFQPDGPVSTVLLPLYENFSSNDQPDSVRLQTAQNCVSLGRVLGDVASPLSEHELQLLRTILPLIVSSIDDRSWRVRWTASAKFADLIQSYDPLPDAIDALIPAYEKLLQDPEAEVRCAATFNLASVASCQARVPVSEPDLSTPTSSTAVPRQSVAERLVKRVMSLTEDDSEYVRAALANVATKLAPLLGTELTISHLVPPVLLLLRDASSEVRLNLISSLSFLNEVIGVDLLSQSLLPAIVDLAQDSKWRIRYAIIEHIPMLAEQLGSEFFTERLVGICVGWLMDSIATVREAAAKNMEQLTSLFGVPWAIEHLLPQIEQVRENDSYLRRMTALHACCRIASCMEKQMVQSVILPIVLDMATDIVPNIRFNVAKELVNFLPLCETEIIESQVYPILQILAEDEDRDVRYFAEKSLSTIEQAATVR